MTITYSIRCIIALLILGSPGIAVGQAAVAEQTTNDVTLVKAGSQPRRALRYELKPNSTETFVVQEGLIVEGMMGAQATPKMKFPETTASIKFTVTGGGTDALTYRFELANVDVSEEGVNPALVAAMKRDQVTDGVAGTGMMNDRGIIDTAKLEFADDADDRTKNAIGMTHARIRRNIIRFPEEPVGVGAVWAQTISFQQPGMGSAAGGMADVVSTLTVKGIDADSVTVGLTFDQSLAKEDLERLGKEMFKNAPAGMKPTINSIVFTGAGTAVVKLSALCPALETSLKMKQLATVTIPGLGEQKMVNDLTITNRVANGD